MRPDPIGVPRLRLSGSDTREAGATPSVRAAAVAAALAAAPAAAAAAGAAAVWARWAAVPVGAGPWIASALAAAGAASAFVAWRLPAPVPSPGGDLVSRAGAGVVSALALAAVALAGAVSADAALVAVAIPVAVLLGGWTAGRAAALAAASCVPDVRPAAAGIVLVAACTAGAAGAVHLTLVAAGAGLPRASGWAAVYAAAAAAALVAAGRRMRAGTARIAIRLRDDHTDHPRAALVVQSVAVAFGPQHVLDDVGLVARARELTALIGANGAGKSTLLRAAAGLVVPAAGRVLLSGHDVTTLRPEDRAVAGLAFVSGARPVFADLTVLHNLRVAAFRTHRGGRAFADATSRVLDLVPALAGRIDDRAGVLSGGEQRLLAVAQSLYRRPVVLLADELTLGLDDASRAAVLDLLRALADDGVAVVVVDHDLSALLARADRVVLLSRGGSRGDLTPSGLLAGRRDLLPAEFLTGTTR